MIPEGLSTTNITVTAKPSKTYGLNINKDFIAGKKDTIEAVKQAVYLMLNTERYDWLIFSWNYGIELKDLFGKPINYVKSELKRRIKEALTQDDRISDVSDFSFEKTARNTLSVKFTVTCDYGAFESGVSVNV
ncbi:MAG: DUF2634 domain-containing protein [Clostridia bacterium]|jgi:uncharacterized protein with ParB-like and HNH nuclease domain|nr:DUF2634 domain-containing protein [Clostridia bacterium]